MSLSAAISSAVSALTAQASALATVSNNLANSSTVGYKASGTSFAALVAGDLDDRGAPHACGRIDRHARRRDAFADGRHHGHL